MPEFGEIINLGFDTLVFAFLIIYFRLTGSPHRFFIMPVCLLFLTHLFTVVEDFGAPILFGILEHVFFLLSITALAWGLFRLRRGKG